MKEIDLKLEGGCQTTAMGIMPHRDTDRALELALSLDIPFWPQLPKVSFLEDMYAQVSEHFPGIILDMDRRVISFSTWGRACPLLLLPTSWMSWWISSTSCPSRPRRKTWRPPSGKDKTFCRARLADNWARQK